MKRLLALAALLPPLTAMAAPLGLLTYAKIARGMNEGEVLQIAGPPDSVVIESERPVIIKSYYYFSNNTEPNTTRIIFSGGNVSEVQRDRRF